MLVYTRGLRLRVVQQELFLVHLAAAGGRGVEVPELMAGRLSSHSQSKS